MKFIPYLVLALALFAGSTRARAAADSRRDAILERDSLVYREARTTASPLGQYKKGLKLKVFVPDRNGFFAIYYPTAIQGSHYGWIPSQNLSFKQPVDTPEPVSKAYKSWWIGIGIDHTSFSPTDFQKAMGEAPLSLGQTGFEFMLGHRFSKLWFGEFRYQYYAVSSGILTSSDPVSNFYFENGDLVTFSAGIIFYETGIASFRASAGPGISLNQAGDSYGANQTPSKVYTGLGLTVRVGVDLAVSDLLSVAIEGADQFHSISGVALIDAKGNPIASTNFSLSTLVLDATVAIHF